MKVLILSVTAGQGHNSTGKALVNFFEKTGVECLFLDAFECINPLIAKSISEGYNFSSKLVKPYAKAYRFAELREKNADSLSAAHLANEILASRLGKNINEYKPDVIICTHCFAAAIVNILKQKKKISSYCIGIVTDFTMHPFWEESIHFDYIVTPSELLNMQAYKKGFSDKQILPFGIPIDPKFSAPPLSKQAARSAIGLDTEKLTVLLMSGSMGYGNIEDTVSKLDNIDVDFQTIVVCGNNKDAFLSVSGMEKRKHFEVMGYVNNIELLMDASDCIITKPGGLTTSEALAKNLPMIIVNPIPGQEDRNCEFLLNNGVAMKASETCPLEEVIYQFFCHKDREANMKHNIALIRRPESTKNLCEFVLRLENNR